MNEENKAVRIQNSNYVTPTFRLHLHKHHVHKVAKLSFPGTRINPRVPEVLLTEAAFLADEVHMLDAADKLHVTYAISQYGFSAVPKKGQQCGAFKPTMYLGVDDREGIVGKVVDVLPSLAEQWLNHRIDEGRIPPALDQTYVSCDFQVSIQTAMELGASIWTYPDLDSFGGGAMPGPDGMVEIQHKIRNCVPFTNKIKFKSSDEADAINDFLGLMQAGLFDMREKHPDNLEMALSLLPVCTMVSTTVSKTVSGWRQWILSDSQSYETFYLKMQFYKQAARYAAALFVGCEKVIPAFDKYEALIKGK